MRLYQSPSLIAGEFEIVRLVFAGPIPTKKNKLRPRSAGAGRGQIYDKKTTGELEALALQARAQWGARGALLHPALSLLIRTGNQSQDRDGILTTLLDSLKTARVIEDDAIRFFNGVLEILPAEINDLYSGPNIQAVIDLTFPSGSAVRS